jgi:FixJ family two-component response regulator
MCPAARVTVVDDEAPVRAALGRLLRLADYEVALFASGAEFLASLDTGVPHCLILDVHMAGLSGLDVQLRLRVALIDIPVVSITASDDPALDEAVLKAGAVRLLRKPFSGDELLEAVQVALATANRTND